MTKEKWLPVSVVANRLNVSETTVRRLVSRRYLKGRRVGVRGCIQVCEDSVEVFVKDRVEKEFA